MDELGKYAVLYIDPPWQFKVWSRDTGSGRSAESHYPTLSIKEMKRLNMQSLMARDCVVLMWACMPTLPEAIDLGRAWGLTYKTTAFTWVKRNRIADTFFVGLGYWTRANAELCLLFTRGKPKRVNADVQQIVYAPVGRHSAKPHEVYGRIERLVTGPYCEVFARNRRDGWDAIGNEIDGRDIRDVVGYCDAKPHRDLEIEKPPLFKGTL